MAVPFLSHRSHQGHLRLAPTWLIRMLLGVAVCGAACGIAIAGPDETDDDEDIPPALPSGLIAEYTGAGRSITRIDPALHFKWHDASPDPRLSPGNFTARWSGKLSIIAPGSHTFYVYAGGGAVRLSINGRPLLDRAVDAPQWLDSEPIELDYGHHAIEVEFRRTAPVAEIGLYWSGPRFRLEPVPERAFVHKSRRAAENLFEQGRFLVHWLRCAACHELPDAQPVPTAPSLAKLSGNIERTWLMNWIGGPKTVPVAPPAHDKPANNPPRPEEQTDDKLPPPPPEPEISIIEAHVASDILVAALDDVNFRMPGLGLNREDARHIVAYLLDENSAMPKPEKELPVEEKLEVNAAAGDTLFASLGCMGCHAIAGLGTAGVSSGGELYNVADKRPADFFARWLADPSASNPTHRMPVFPLSEDERNHLASFLAQQHGVPEKSRELATVADYGGKAERGRDLIRAHRCGACHELPRNEHAEAPQPAEVRPRRIPADADWEKSCLGEPDPARARPGYRLRPEQHDAVVGYVRAMMKGPRSADSVQPLDGERVLADRNCLGCHARGLSPGIAAHVAKFVAPHPELAAALATLAPPALTEVGDKLDRAALLEAMTTAGDPRRAWLKIRMPRFKFAPGEVEALADWLIAADRLPERPASTPQAVDERAPIEDKSLATAGHRLVTSEGFGCASCHQIGKSMPKQDNPAAHGTDLSLVGKRIRREWFDRWVRNPARIVPRMEMPAIEIPVGGVLDERLDDQLSAVWHVLNEPGFTPPAAGAVRVVRTRNMPNESERAAILTDVFRVDGRSFIRPFVVGLPNRHTVLLDLEENRLAGWWLGDAARERNQGKRWYWEPGGTHVLAGKKRDASELTLGRDGRSIEPVPAPQFLALLDSWRHVNGGVVLDYRLTFPADEGAAETMLHISQRLTALGADAKSGRAGFRRRMEIRGVPRDANVQLRLLPEGVEGRADGDTFTAASSPADEVAVRVTAPAGATISNASKPILSINASGDDHVIVCEAEYTSELAADRYPAPLVAPGARPAVTFHCIPGFDAVRLPLPATEMPTGFAWRRDGTLLFTSLKGEAWLAPDTDRDGLPDTLHPLADELAAPYGLCTAGESIDVINRNGLLRLSEFDTEGRARRTDVVADGWGHTADYHDWAIGPVPDESGGYFVALPCRQDERNEVAARLRGWAIRLTPRNATADNPRLFDVLPFCSGLRFPMGLARNRDGAIFATDNQGHYNPFNELNHLIPDAHYGFFSKAETRQATPSPRQDAAIEIPHPWTRSVNGICFLKTPDNLRAATDRDLFGPWEGHLVGCEYDTRRLVRMSLERIGETYQGAAYPLSVEPVEGEETFEGPVVCQVGPDGALYVGNMRDSGWGAGQNTGSIVRLRVNSRPPPGIAEVRAAADGFTIDFTQPVGPAAAKAGNYMVESFRRIPTSDYGGPDVDRRADRVRSVTVSDDRRSVHLALDELRPGFVYEFHLKNLGAGGERFHPSEAYYTLRTVPAKE